MAINNSDNIIDYSSVLTHNGLTDHVFEARRPINEDFSIDKDGTRTITWTHTLRTTQEAEKQDIANSQAWYEIIQPFILGEFSFYPESVSMSRVAHVYGRTATKADPAVIVPCAKWEVKADYKTRQTANENKDREDDNTLKPSERQPVITWNSNRFDMGTTTDAFNNPYQNTAGDYFEGISRPAQERIYSITTNHALNIVPTKIVNGELVPKTQREIIDEIKALNEAGTSYEPDWMALSNYVNSTPVNIRGTRWAENTLLVTNISGGEIKIDNKEVYFESKVALTGRWWGWQREVANRGGNERQWYIIRGSLGETFDGSPVPEKDYPILMGSPEVAAALATFRLQVSAVPAKDEMAGFSNEQILNNTNQVNFRKVPTTDAKGRPLRNPVFLDGYGQAQKSDGVAEGTVGTVTYSTGNKFGTASFNVYDFLGQKLTLQPSGQTVYIPESAEQLKLMHVTAGITNFQAMYDAKASNDLVFMMSKSSGVRGANGEFSSLANGSMIQEATSNGQQTIVTTPGVMLTFQDYRPADLSVIPGIYSA